MCNTAHCENTQIEITSLVGLPGIDITTHILDSIIYCMELLTTETQKISRERLNGEDEDY